MFSLIVLKELEIVAPRDPPPGVAARGGAARRAAVALPFPGTQCVVPGSTPMGSGGGVRCAGRGFEGGPGTPGECPERVRFGRGAPPLSTLGTLGTLGTSLSTPLPDLSVIDER